MPEVPTAVILRMHTPPEIDGVMEPEEWKQSTAVSGFTEAGKDMSARQPVAYLAYDDEYLYFAFYSSLEENEVLKANIGDDDERLICLDDSFEIYYHPPAEKEGLDYYYQVLFNSRGSILDNAAEPFGQNNLGWNAHIYYQSKIVDHAWIVEGRIPWSSYGLTKEDLLKPGHRMNICRNSWRSQTSWSRSKAFTDLRKSALISFASDVPSIKVLDVLPLSTEKRSVSGEVSNTTEHPVDIRIQLTVDGKSEDRLIHVSAGETIPWTINASETSNETFVAELSISDSTSHAVYYEQMIPVKVNPAKRVNTNAPLPVRFNSGFSRISDAVSTEIDIYHFGEKASVRSATVEVLTDHDGELHELGSEVISSFSKSIARKIVYLRSALQRDNNVELVVRLTLYDEHGTSLYSEDQTLKIQSFDWENNTIGVSDKVLSPFTPLEVENNTVKCWNRSYIFGGDGMLRAVSSGDESIISQPMVIRGDVAGKSVESESADTHDLIRSTPHEVIIGGRGTIGDTLDYNVRSTIEYDGMVRFDVTLQPREMIRVENLTVAIPVEDSITSYINATGDYMRKNSYCGPLSKEEGLVWSSLQHSNMKVKGSFIPFIWLSNDENGLCWLAESDQGWKLDFSKAALELIREDSTVFLNMNIVNKSVMIDKPISFQFVLQATPVKPMIKGWRTAGIGKGNFLSPDEDNSLNFFWFNWGTPGRWKIDKQYEKPVAQANENGAISSIYNNWSAFPYSLKTVASDSLDSYLGDWNGAAMVKSVQDCVLFHADQLLAEGKIGGIYCDDSWPQASTNVLNKTAYLLENGDVQPGFAILKQREYCKRVAHMLEKHGKRPGLWIHDTHALMVPYLAFADVSMDGEDHPVSELSNDFIDQWSFERLRAGARGTKIGTIPFWLPLVRANPRTTDPAIITKLSRTMIGPLMLHDYITYYTWAGWDKETVSTLQKVKLDFGIGDDSVTFHPYWNNANEVQSSSEDIYASFYRNKQTLLVTVVNKSRRDENAVLTLNTSKLGLSDPVVINTETGESILCKDGKVSFELPYHDFALLKITDRTAGR